MDLVPYLSAVILISTFDHYDLQRLLIEEPGTDQFVSPSPLAEFNGQASSMISKDTSVPEPEPGLRETNFRQVSFWGRGTLNLELRLGSVRFRFWDRL